MRTESGLPNSVLLGESSENELTDPCVACPHGAGDHG